MRCWLPPVPILPLLCLFAACHEQPPAPPPPPPDVKVAEVLQRDVPVYVEVIGETRGNTEIEIRARVEGFIERVDYKEGSEVKKGQLLYTIDARPFEARLAASKASLAEAEAQYARARQDVVRYEPLVAKNAISRQEYETAVALEKAAAAVVEAGQALVEQAEIDLSYTRVMAPEDGLAGRTEVYAGTLVGRGQSTLLTRISRTDPIHVRFSFPEKDYLALARKRGTGVTPDSERKTTFELFTADGTLHPAPGELVFVDRNVDPRTGTIMVEAAFPNPGLIMRPGQYGRIRATVDRRAGAILVPQRAVVEQQGVFSVLVLAAGDKVEQRLVTPAERRGALWVMASGLKAGEKIVVEGLQKVRPGIQVKPQTVLIEDEVGTSAQPRPAGGTSK
ncbi:MAG: efflux RND transporter periplasmic adaptor subunit [Planctomycetes bacterium]|nr:efflux RND transporter periplasmic adaptor subunit [Planctomycetota bacterium]